MAATKTANIAAPAPKQLIITAEGLNVREAPTLQAKVVDILSRGNLVQRIGSSGDGYFHKYLRPESAPAKAVGADCGARFLKAHPVVDPISHGWYFDDPVFIKDLTYTLAGDMDRNVIPTQVTTPTLSLSEK